MDRTNAPITTIDEVIEELKLIIAVSKKDDDPLRYFAALYNKVTIAVKKGIEDGAFEDGTRMEHLDVIFASRYINAYHAFKADKKTTLSRFKAFDLSTNYWPIVLQHLLIGMNAHINLDLGIAAAEVMESKDINLLKNDFDKINEILASLVNDVENDLSTIWPTFRKILKLTHGVNDFLVNFGMKEARIGAWKFAVDLSSKSGHDFQKSIEERDLKVAKTGELVTNPGILPNFIFGLIRLSERGTVSKKIHDLAN